MSVENPAYDDIILENTGDTYETLKPEINQPGINKNKKKSQVDPVRKYLIANISISVLCVILVVVIGTYPWKIGEITRQCDCTTPQSKPDAESNRCDIRPCDKQLCLNNGTCSEKAGVAVCSCQDMYYGDHCELAEKDSTDDSSDRYSCLNGGRNLPSTGCICPDMYYGEHCERDRSLEENLTKNISSCSESSVSRSSTTCRYAYEGSELPSDYHEWASNRRGVGAWMNIILDKSYVITRVNILQRCARIEQISKMSLAFSDSSLVEVEFGRYGTHRWTVCDGVPWESFTIPPTRTTSINFTITEVYTSLNNGLREIDLWGY